MLLTEEFGIIMMISDYFLYCKCQNVTTVGDISFNKKIYKPPISYFLPLSMLGYISSQCY